MHPILWTRAFVIGGTVLIGLWLFHWHRLKSLQWGLIDLPIALWCVMPLASGLIAGLGLTVTLQNTLYQTIVWGGPYLVGRVHLSTPEGRRAFAQVFIVAGLIYLPLCLLENAFGPFIYEAVYGYHWYNMDGNNRWIGYRPLIFMEHGNALGIWMATTAIVGFASWRSGVLNHWPRWLSWTAGIGLPCLAVLCQSVGPIILLALALIVFALSRRLKPAVLLAAIALPLLLIVGLRLADPIHIKPAIRAIGGQAALDRIRQVPKAGSLGWRVRRQEEQMPAIYEAPFFGHGTWNWWQERGPAPWGMWMLTLGAFGTLGLLLMFSCFLLPIVLFLWHTPPPTWSIHPQAYFDAGLAAALAMSFIDAGLNSTFNIVLLALAPGLLAAAKALPAHTTANVPNPA